MSNEHNPYGNPGGSYTTNVQFGAETNGSAEQSKHAVKETTTAKFATDVLKESRNQPVLVDFWAPWCGPCRQLAPVLEKVVEEAAGRVKLVKMNTDEHPAVFEQLGLRSIPAVIAFRDGQPVDGFTGNIPESKIREFIAKIGGKDKEAEVNEALAAAAEARAAGDLQAAADIFGMILSTQPDNVEALGGFADLLFETGNVEGATGMLAQAPEDKKDAPVLAAVRARIALAEQAASLGDPAPLERRLAADANDHEARFDLAMIQNALGKRNEAADNLLAIIKADRAWRDDGARSQLLQFFDAWGLMDEATLSARRKLSSILFS